MRSVYACTLQFTPALTALEELTRCTSEWIAAWYARRELGEFRGHNLPDVRDGISKIEGHLLRYTDDDFDEQRLRILNWSYPDERDPTLAWHSKVNLFECPEELVFELVISLRSTAFSIAPARFNLGSPRIVRDLVGRGDARVSGVNLRSIPYFFSADEVETFVKLLTWRDRRFPIIVVSPDELNERPSIDPERLASLLAGLAVVAVPRTAHATWEITARLGKVFSCFDGAVRVYWPRIDLAASPFFHPLWLRTRIQAVGEKGFLDRLVRLVAGVAASRFVVDPRIEGFIRARELRDRESAVRSAQATRDYDQLFNEYASLDARHDELQQEFKGLQAENENLKEALVGYFEVQTGEVLPEVDQDPEPQSVLEAVTSAARQCDNLIFLPEAYEAARESPFKQPGKVLSILSAVDWVASVWKRGLAEGGSTASWVELFREKGFEFAPRISQTARNKWGSEYTYTYEGRRILVEKHITIGAKQPDKCLSVYFEPDDDLRKLAIFHVGRHKRNTTS